jgi:hypothetical protein
MYSPTACSRLRAVVLRHQLPDDGIYVVYSSLLPSGSLALHCEKEQQRRLEGIFRQRLQVTPVSG